MDSVINLIVVFSVSILFVLAWRQFVPLTVVSGAMIWAAWLVDNGQSLPVMLVSASLACWAYPPIFQRSFAAGLLVMIGCTANQRFEPTKQVSVAAGQLKSIVPGEGAPHSGMDCLKYIEYQIAHCEATLTCTSMQYKRLERAARRLNKGFRSQCVYDDNHIREAFRHMQRGFGR